MAGNQLSGPLPAAWARNPAAADGRTFPVLRVAALLPSAGPRLLLPVHTIVVSSTACQGGMLCSNDRAAIRCQTEKSRLLLLQARACGIVAAGLRSACGTSDITSASLICVPARRQWAPLWRHARGAPARNAARRQRRQQQPRLFGARCCASRAAVRGAAAACGRIASACCVRAGNKCGHEH